MRWPFSQYSNAVHDFVIREIEVGRRVALAEDDEACGMGPLLDLQYAEYMRSEMGDEIDKAREVEQLAEDEAAGRVSSPELHRTSDFYEEDEPVADVVAAFNAAEKGMTRPQFVCPRCGKTSHHPVDAIEGYCAKCHDWTGASGR